MSKHSESQTHSTPSLEGGRGEGLHSNSLEGGRGEGLLSSSLEGGRGEGLSFVVGLGEILWDMLPSGPQLGGAPANFAYHAGRLLGSEQCLAVSALGHDALGDETVHALQVRHLQALLPRVAFPTGTVQVTLTGNGIPTYNIRESVAWDNIPFDADIQSVAARCCAVCFGSLAQRSSVSRATIHAFLDATPPDCLKVFDINLRQHYYSKLVIEKSLRRCNILKINDEELAVLQQMYGLKADGAGVQQVCRQLLYAYGLKVLILTCGTNGSYVFTPDAVSFIETPRVKVVDTVGAGDAFTAAFVASILQGRSVPESHRTAVHVSACVCTQRGAMGE